MNFSTIIGLVLGIGSVFLSGYMELNHLNPEGITPFLKPSALIMIFGGTIGAAMTGANWQVVVRVPKLMFIAFTEPRYKPDELTQMFIHFAEKARREGMLALQSDIEELDDPFLNKGLQLVVDGVSPETIRDVIESDIDNLKLRHKEGQEFFGSMGGYAPTMGIVGTVLGLIAALAMAAAGAETNKVVGAIATAFIATFYGIAGANLLFLPIQGKLKALDEKEEAYRELVMTGIISIMSGDNPAIVYEKLSVFIESGKRVTREESAAAQEKS